MIRPRFKALEGLVQQTALRLKELAEENRRLRRQIDELTEETRQRQGERRRVKTLDARQTRIKTRLERIVQKLDRIAG